jgi:hypothetical protein
MKITYWFASSQKHNEVKTLTVNADAVPRKGELLSFNVALEDGKFIANGFVKSVE